MGKFTGKGNHTVKVGNQSHTNTKTSNGEESTHAFEIKRPATESYIYIQTAISKPHGNCKPKTYKIHTHKKKK